MFGSTLLSVVSYFFLRLLVAANPKTLPKKYGGKQQAKDLLPWQLCTWTLSILIFLA